MDTNPRKSPRVHGRDHELKAKRKEKVWVNQTHTRKVNKDKEDRSIQCGSTIEWGPFFRDEVEPPGTTPHRVVGTNTHGFRRRTYHTTVLSVSLPETRDL